MSLPVAYRNAARTEFIEGAAWYEAKRPGLGQEFITEIERCIERISESPMQYPVVYKNLRRINARRFPYGVYFLVEPDRVVVLAVFHGHRDPGVWQARA